MCATAFADEQPPQIPPDLVQVKSGGQWEEAGKNGFVRFSAFERGFEHVRHQVVIEWIHVPDSPNEKLAVASIVSKDIPDVWAIAEATFVVKDGKISIHFDATNTYLTENAPSIQSRYCRWARLR